MTGGVSLPPSVAVRPGDCLPAGGAPPGCCDLVGLWSIKRQVEQRTQDLELEGLNAAAADWAELKRLKQQVEIAEAQGALAPPNELARLESQLAKETARRDIDAVQRDRAQAAELGALHGEIDLRKAELELIKLRDARDDAETEEGR